MRSYRWSAIRALVLCKLAQVRDTSSYIESTCESARSLMRHVSQVIREFGEPSSSTLDTRVAAIATALVRLPEYVWR